MLKILTGIILVVLSFPLFADEIANPPRALPTSSSFSTAATGSASYSYGVTPVGSSNQVDLVHIDQGLSIGKMPSRFGLKPYVALDLIRGTEGQFWVRKEKAETGVKLVYLIPKGIVDFGVAYIGENRAATNSAAESKSDTALFTSGWFRFGQPAIEKRTQNFFADPPGSVQWIVGNTSPFEKDNLLGSVRLEHSLPLSRRDQYYFALLSWGQANFDSNGYAWNNRYINGIGVKMERRWDGGIAQITAGYECIKTHYKWAPTDIPATCGAAIKLDMWLGWMNGN